MSYSFIFGFWAVIWLVNLINGAFASFWVAPKYGGYIAHLYANLSIIPFYFYAAGLYIKMVKRLNFNTYARTTGLIWVLMTVLADVAAWNFIMDIPEKHVLNQLMFWEGKIYILQMAGLYLSVPIMKRKRKGKRRRKRRTRTSEQVSE